MSFSVDTLKEYVHQIELLEGEKAEISGKLTILYSDAKSDGFDVKVLKKLVKLRHESPDERKMQESILNLYKQVLGME